MEEEFRAAAKADLSRLLALWKEIEASIKQAEQISSEAQIPAINELRYASRQVFNAIVYLDNDNLSKDEQENINRRIIVAEQYLHNAEHDISDSIVTFYRQVIADVEERHGRNVITTHFPLFPLFREHIKECERLILETRGNYELRGSNYAQIRTNHIPHLLSLHDELIDAQVSAEEERQRTERAIQIAGAKITGLTIFSVIAGICAIIAVPLSVYLWMYGKDEVCKAHPWLTSICSVGQSTQSVPSTGGSPNAPARQ
jgi:hypothetical protein